MMLVSIFSLKCWHTRKIHVSPSTSQKETRYSFLQLRNLRPDSNGKVNKLFLQDIDMKKRRVGSVWKQRTEREMAMTCLIKL